MGQDSCRNRLPPISIRDEKGNLLIDTNPLSRIFDGQVIGRNAK